MHIIAILKRNEKDLLKVQDDSELLAVVKGFFASLNIQVYDEEEDAKRAEVTYKNAYPIETNIICIIGFYWIDEISRKKIDILLYDNLGINTYSECSTLISLK